MLGKSALLTKAVTIFLVLTTACNRNMPEKTEVAHPAQQEKEQPQVPPKTIVKLQTSMGDISIELFTEKSPITCSNCLKYVENGFYNDTIFHRVIPDFMIQGGGLTADMKEKSALAPIKNEASNGLENLRGTIAMARTANPDSATCQFFINHRDNSRLNYVSSQNQGYAVFGRVTEGMDVVDRIAKVKTTDKGPHANVPVEPVIIKSVSLIKQNATP